MPMCAPECIHVSINLTVRHLVFRWPGVTFTHRKVEIQLWAPSLFLYLFISHDSRVHIIDTEFDRIIYAFTTSSLMIINSELSCEMMKKRAMQRAEMNKQNRLRMQKQKKVIPATKQTNKQTNGRTNERTNEHRSKYANNCISGHWCIWHSFNHSIHEIRCNIERFGIVLHFRWRRIPITLLLYWSIA